MTQGHTLGSMKSSIQSGPIGPALSKLGLPIFIGMLCTVSFQLADTYFVGTLGAHTLSAIGLVFPVTMTLMHVSTGLDIGTMSTVSRRIGAGDKDGARKLVMDSMWLSITLSLTLTTVGLFTIDPIFEALGADATTMPYVRQYMQVWYCGLVITNLPSVFAAAMRANGNAAVPGALQSGAALFNVLLDPLMIFGVGAWGGMGIAGAAIATVIARSLYAIALGVMLARREGLLAFSGYSPAGMLASWRHNLNISLPASVGNILSATTGIITVTLVARHGTSSVAGLAVGMRVEALALISTLSLAIAMAPFIGQNLGARNYRRIHDALMLGWKACAAIGLGLWVLAAVAGPSIAAAFSDQAAVQGVTVSYLVWVGAAFGLSGMVAVGTIALNAMGAPLLATGLTIVRVGVIYGPLAWLLDRSFGIPGVLGAMVLSQVVIAAVTIFAVHMRLRELSGDTGSTAPALA